MLKQPKECYENNEERLQEQVWSKYRGLCNKKKIIRREYGRNIYRKMSKEDKPKLKEYQKCIVT